MRSEYGSLEPAAVFGENGGVLARIVAFVLPLGLDTLAIAIALGLQGQSPLRPALLFVVFETTMPLIGNSGTVSFPIQSPLKLGCWEPVNGTITHPPCLSLGQELIFPCYERSPVKPRRARATQSPWTVPGARRI